MRPECRMVERKPLQASRRGSGESEAGIVQVPAHEGDASRLMASVRLSRFLPMNSGRYRGSQSPTPLDGRSSRRRDLRREHACPPGLRARTDGVCKRGGLRGRAEAGVGSSRLWGPSFALPYESWKDGESKLDVPQMKKEFESCMGSPQKSRY